MAVKGKKQYKVYLNQKNTERIKFYLKSKSYEGGFSLLVDKCIESTSMALSQKVMLTNNLHHKKLSAQSMYEMLKDSIKKETKLNDS